MANFLPQCRDVLEYSPVRAFSSTLKHAKYVLISSHYLLETVPDCQSSANPPKCVPLKMAKIRHWIKITMMFQMPDPCAKTQT